MNATSGEPDRLPARVSVLIPHLDQPEHLFRCLSSLKAQSFEQDLMEIVVIDNGSKSPPTKICQAFDGVRLETEHIPGPGPARNKGVAKSEGSILAFIDADCIADDVWVDTIVREIGRDGENKVLGGDVRIMFDNPSRPTLLESYECIFAFRQKEYIEKHGYSGTGNLAMRRDDFLRVGPFGGIDVAEDADWGRRAEKLGYSTTYVPEMVVYHPARETFAQLYAKWDRHIKHAYLENSKLPFWRTRWALRAVAIAASGFIDIVRRVLHSCQVSTWRERFLAAIGLIRIRLYRARRMLRLLFRGA